MFLVHMFLYYNLTLSPLCLLDVHATPLACGTEVHVRKSVQLCLEHTIALDTIFVRLPHSQSNVEGQPTTN